MWFRPSRNSFNRPQPFRPRLEALEDRSLPSGGALDPTFGTGGIVITPAGASSAAHSVAVQNDGKIVAAGQTISSDGSSDMAVVRYNIDGSLDSTFNGTGKATTNFGAADIANGVVVQPDGKIVAGGATRSASGNIDFALARYTSGGTLDRAFGSQGKVTTNFSKGSADAAIGVALQSDGKIVLGGTTGTTSVPTGNNLALARYTSAGSLDASFGNGGEVITSFTTIPGSLGTTRVYGMGVYPVHRLQPTANDDKIVLVGTTKLADGYHVFVVRYSAAGQLDTTFGG